MSRPPAAAPVFLVGAARSGTSLLYKCLCLHPDAAYISNWVRRFPNHPGLAVLNRVPARLPSAQRRVWFGGGDNAYVYGSPRRLLDRVFPMPVEGEPLFNHCGVPAPGADVPAAGAAQAAPLRDAVGAITRAGGGRVFVSKRIANNWRIPTLDAAFPEARFVEIVRDGRAVAYSLSRVEWWPDSDLPWLGGTPRQWQEAGMDPWELCARNWVAELDAVASGLDAVDPGRRLRIRYEEFVAAPQAILGQVAAFAGLRRSETWDARLVELRFPDRNESWRSRLEPALISRIEDLQCARLRENGYVFA